MDTNQWMEIKQRMRIRFPWVLGLLVLFSIGFLLACGNNYSSSSDGLVLVGSQGSALIETFSFNLSSGHIAGIANPPSSTASQTCILPGLPAGMVLDPAGAYAYVILNSNTSCMGSQTGIATFKVNSDGTLTPTPNLTLDPNPVALAMDSKGQFLFVAEGTYSSTNFQTQTFIPCPGTVAQSGVCVYSVSNGSLTPVPGNFTFPGPLSAQAPDFVALATTPTVFPSPGINGAQNSVCSDVGNSAPTNEFLYVADSANNVVYEFVVDTSSGVITSPAQSSTNPGYFQTGAVPSGVTVEACDRFVYVSNQTSNNISAFTICNGLPTESGNCPATPDGGLFAVDQSPFSLSGGANGPGPLQADPFGNNLYVVDVKSNMVSPFHISAVSGGLTAGANVATGVQPSSLAIRGDDNWLFVTNFAVGTLSQYSITPSTGALSPLPAVTTDNYPFGVAVK